MCIVLVAGVAVDVDDIPLGDLKVLVATLEHLLQEFPQGVSRLFHLVLDLGQPVVFPREHLVLLNKPVHLFLELGQFLVPPAHPTFVSLKLMDLLLHLLSQLADLLFQLVILAHDLIRKIAVLLCEIAGLFSELQSKNGSDWSTIESTYILAVAE